MRAIQSFRASDCLMGKALDDKNARTYSLLETCLGRPTANIYLSASYFMFEVGCVTDESEVVRSTNHPEGPSSIPIRLTCH